MGQMHSWRSQTFVSPAGPLTLPAARYRERGRWEPVIVSTYQDLTTNLQFLHPAALRVCQHWAISAGGMVSVSSLCFLDCGQALGVGVFPFLTYERILRTVKRPRFGLGTRSLYDRRRHL